MQWMQAERSTKNHERAPDIQTLPGPQGLGVYNALLEGRIREGLARQGECGSRGHRVALGHPNRPSVTVVRPLGYPDDKSSPNVAKRRAKRIMVPFLGQKGNSG